MSDSKHWRRVWRRWSNSYCLCWSCFHSAHQHNGKSRPNVSLEILESEQQMPRRSAGGEELLRAKLEVSELRHRVNELDAVIVQLQNELKESNRLLLRQRLPSRERVTSLQRQQIAARQRWQCVGGVDCPLKVINPPGLFTWEALYEIDHVVPWSQSGRHLGNLRALCAHCHSRATRELVQRGIPTQVDSDSE